MRLNLNSPDIAKGFISLCLLVKLPLNIAPTSSVQLMRATPWPTFGIHFEKKLCTENTTYKKALFKTHTILIDSRAGQSEGSTSSGPSRLEIWTGKDTSCGLLSDRCVVLAYSLLYGGMIVIKSGVISAIDEQPGRTKINQQEL